MEIIELTKDHTIVIPDGYERIPLPFFNEWIAALESGKYKQGTMVLKDFSDGYCCLGVLSAVQGRLTENGCDTIHSQFNSLLYSDNPCAAVFGGFGDFPMAIKDATSTYASRAGKQLTNVLYGLTSLNDSGVPFSEIANVIKKVWKPIE